MAVFRSLGVIVRIEMMDILVCIQKNLFAHKEISGIAVRIKAIGILFPQLSPYWLTCQLSRLLNLLEDLLCSSPTKLCVKSEKDYFDSIHSLSDVFKGRIIC